MHQAMSFICKLFTLHTVSAMRVYPTRTLIPSPKTSRVNPPAQCCSIPAAWPSWIWRSGGCWRAGRRPAR